MGNVYANRGTPQGVGYQYVAPNQATGAPYPGAEQHAPVSPAFGANPLLGSGLPGWPCQMPSEGIGGHSGGGATAEPGSGSQFSHR